MEAGKATQGKGAKFIEEEKESKKKLNKYSKESPGALDLNMKARVKMERNGNTIHDGQIIDCREAVQRIVDEGQDESYKYEYYIHYIGENRRLDEWVQRSKIQITDQPLQELDKLALLEEAKENEECEGMDPNSVRLHEENTKFKTINKIKLGRFEMES